MATFPLDGRSTGRQRRLRWLSLIFFLVMIGIYTRSLVVIGRGLGILSESLVELPVSGLEGNTTLCASEHATNKGGDHDGLNQWTVVVSGNSGYEQDLLVWWYHCQKVGLCESSSQQTMNTMKTTNDPCSEQAVGVRPPSPVVFYAEDPPIFQKYQSSPRINVQKAWTLDTNFSNITVSGTQRFAYDEQKKFFQMMSRRPSMILQELRRISGNGSPTTSTQGLLFCDLDVFLLQDPRPYFVGNFDMWGANARNSRTGPYNAGFLALRPTMIPVIQQWKDLLESRTKPSPNQISFNNILKRQNATLRHKLLDKGRFPIGKLIDDIRKEQQSSSSGQKDFVLNETSLNRDMVVAFHNNYCEGSCNKTERAVQLGLWTMASQESILGLAS